MNIGEFESRAIRFGGAALSDPVRDSNIEQIKYAAIGLPGEVGEVLELLKRGLFRDHGQLDKVRLREELGDVLWYLAFLCSRLDIPLEQVAEANLAKLEARYPGRSK